MKPSEQTIRSGLPLNPRRRAYLSRRCVCGERYADHDLNWPRLLPDGCHGFTPVHEEDSTP